MGIFFNYKKAAQNKAAPRIKEVLDDVTSSFIRKESLRPRKIKDIEHMARGGTRPVSITIDQKIPEYAYSERALVELIRVIDFYSEVLTENAYDRLRSIASKADAIMASKSVDEKTHRGFQALCKAARRMKLV